MAIVITRRSMIRRTAFQCWSSQQSDHLGTDEKYWPTQWLSFVSFDWMSDADTKPLVDGWTGTRRPLTRGYGSGNKFKSNRSDDFRSPGPARRTSTKSDPAGVNGRSGESPWLSVLHPKCNSSSLLIHSRRLSADVELLVLMCTLASNGPFDVVGPFV